MKTAMLVEGRDEGYLFLDPATAPEDATPMDFTLENGVLFSDIGNEEKVIWMSTDSAIRVVHRETVDFENASFEKEWPIPICVLCLTEADYEAAQQ